MPQLYFGTSVAATSVRMKRLAQVVDAQHGAQQDVMLTLGQVAEEEDFCFL
jgi:hypothetical protein